MRTDFFLCMQIFPMMGTSGVRKNKAPCARSPLHRRAPSTACIMFVLTRMTIFLFGALKRAKPGWFLRDSFILAMKWDTAKPFCRLVFGQTGRVLGFARRIRKAHKRLCFVTTEKI